MTVQTGNTLSLDLLMGPFESGMPKLVQLASLLGATPTLLGLLLTRPDGSTLFLGLLTAPPMCGAHFHIPLSRFPP